MNVVDLLNLKDKVVVVTGGAGLYGSYIVEGLCEAGATVYVASRDAKKNKSYVVKRARKGVREALLSYRLLETKEGKYGEVSLVAIKLSTGRTHQIRVQFASRGMPLVGDGKYGAADNAPSVALLSHKLTFTHPTTKKRMSFEITPESESPWDIFEYNKKTVD